MARAYAEPTLDRCCGAAYRAILKSGSTRVSDAFRAFLERGDDPIQSTSAHTFQAIHLLAHRMGIWSIPDELLEHYEDDVRAAVDRFPLPVRRRLSSWDPSYTGVVPWDVDGDPDVPPPTPIVDHQQRLF